MIVDKKEYFEKDGSLGYIECVYKSDNILKTTYFPKFNRLYIYFGRGNAYSYSNISNDFYDLFEKAESQGKFFIKNINNNKQYPFRREFKLYPDELNELKDIVKNNLIINEEDNG